MIRNNKRGEDMDKGTNKRPDSIWNPMFISVFIANFCQQMGQQMMNSLVPKYSNSIGIAPSLVGVIVSVFAFTALLSRPITGPALDSFSKKKLLILMQSFVFISFLGYGLSRNASSIMISRVFHGIGAGVTAPLCLALASNSLPDDRLANGVGVFTLGQAVAQAIGPNVGIVLSEAIGFNKTFFIGAAITGLAIILSCFIHEPETKRLPYKITLNRIFSRGGIKPAILMMFLGMCYNCISSYIPVYGEVRGIPNIGWFFTAYAVTLIFTRPTFGKLQDKYGFDKVLFPGFVLLIFCLIILSRSDSMPMFLLAAVIGGLGYGVSQSAIQALSMRCSLREERGAAGSTNYIGMDVGSMIGPIIAGNLIEAMQASTGSDVIAYSRMYLFMTIPMVFAFLFLLWQKKSIAETVEKMDALNDFKKAN